ncbi:MAG: hypothetical protein K2X02_08430 [Alphaproteobacteria bacterium]|nr:hypothetical protein [Alphaproteobacteria bacterium]
MAIDLYTGPLTRYYSGLWENQLQALCRKRGEEYKIISPEGINQSQDEPSLTPQKTCEAIKIWMRNLSQSFGCQIKWEEGENISYHTSQFSEFSEVEALSCYVWALEENVVDSFPESLDASKDPIIKNVEKKGQFIFFNAVEFYMPISLPGSGIFQIELPDDREVICSSTQKLLEELDQLTKKVWQVPMNDLNSISEEEIYSNFAQKKEPLTLAIFGLCKLYKNALFSQKNNLPIILDY